MLCQKDHHVSISISDDGKGFDTKRDFEGNGLKNMHSRAREINADLKMTSEIGKGTSVDLSLKIT
jgi:signal transduction histidine kinase